MEIVRPKFLTGIPELFVPNLNPLVISQIKLTNVNSFNSTFKNLRFYGMENFMIDELEFDVNNIKMRMVVTIPKLRCLGDYHIAGRLLIPINGQGHMDSNYSKCSFIVNLFTFLQLFYNKSDSILIYA